MTNEIFKVIGLVLLCIVGVWKYFGRKNAERRKLADEASQKLDEAQKNKDKSSLLDAWHRVNRGVR